MLSHASVRQHATDTTTIIIIKRLSCKAQCAQICQSDITLLAQSLLLLLTLSKSRPYLDKLQLEVLRHVVVLAHPEDDGDDVLGRVTQAPQVSHHLVRFVDAAVDAVLQHVFDQNWVGLVTHLHIQPGSLLIPHKSYQYHLACFIDAAVNLVRQHVFNQNQVGLITHPLIQVVWQVVWH